MELVENQWDIDTLDKAYRQGYMAGMTGRVEQCTHYKADMLIEAWEAGWADGHEVFTRKNPDEQHSELA